MSATDSASLSPRRTGKRNCWVAGDKMPESPKTPQAAQKPHTPQSEERPGTFVDAKVVASDCGSSAKASPRGMDTPRSGMSIDAPRLSATVSVAEEPCLISQEPIPAAPDVVKMPSSKPKGNAIASLFARAAEKQPEKPAGEPEKPASEGEEEEEAKPAAPPPQSFLQRVNAKARTAMAALNGMSTVTPVVEKSTAHVTYKGKDRGPEKVHVERQEALMRVENVIKQIPWLLPDSRVRRTWDTNMLFCHLAHLMVVPLMLIDAIPFGWSMQLLSWIFSFVYLCDSVVRYNTALILNDEVVRDVYVSRTWYIRRWLAIDMASTIPFDCFLVVLGLELHSGDQRYLVRAAMALRMLRLDHVRTLFRLSNPGAIDPEYVRFYFNVVPVLRFIFSFIFCLHILTVLKMAVADDSPSNNETNADDFRYDHSLFWVWNLLTTSPAPLTLNSYSQKVLCFSLMCVGVIFQGVIIGQVSLMLLKSGVRQQNEAKMRTTLDIVEHYNLPASLKQEVLSMQWHALQSSLNFLSNSGQIFERLPTLMRNEINIYIKIDFISKCPMFTEARHQTKIRLANSLRQEFREPGERVIITGDVGSEMFFILHGFCDVLIDGVGSVAVLRRGDFFGEVALLADVPRTATIRTLTYCDFFVLHREPFSKICDGDALFRVAIREKMKAKLPSDKKRDIAVRWRLARHIIMLSRPGESPKSQASKSVEESGSRSGSEEAGSGSDGDADSVSAVDLVHKMALEKTLQDQKSRNRAQGLLQKVLGGRNAAPRERRKSQPLKMAMMRLKSAKNMLGPFKGLQAVPPEPPPPPPRTVTPQGGPLSPTAGTLSSPTGLQRSLSASPTMRSPRAAEEDSLALSVEGRSPVRGRTRGGSSLRQALAGSFKMANQTQPVSPPQPATSPKAAPEATTGAVAAMSSEDKMLYIVEMVQNVLGQQTEMNRQLDVLSQRQAWQGQMLEDLSQRHEESADDVYGAVKNVEEQVWALQDLVGVLIDRGQQNAAGDAPPPDPEAEYKAFVELL
eukprot:TRINITY_DN5394_c0_g1_i2.p1 TRINITY_DN5394_c0_g1~~TRINITY_DN5394_c0_g1_i2.p1  ORF type:complete len:1018 (+),score=235.72 TRINITY_DN5394_c0_g1_i2:56-3109(+)